MTDPLRAIILGVVEGLTEFLPVSSTGHMILVEPLLGIKSGSMPPQAVRFWKEVFDIFIQIGAILAVVLYFWRQLWQLTFKARAASWPDHILVKLFVAFLPAAILGKLAGGWITEHLKTPPVVAGALVVGGILIIAIERGMRHPRFHTAAGVPLMTALLIGVAQCLAMIPGTSRSAATIMGALLLGLTAPAAAEFSFFLAIPTMFAAGGYSLLKYRHDIAADQLGLLGLGFCVAFVVALVVVAGFMRYIQTHKFAPFAVYRIVLGIAVVAVIIEWPGLFAG
ncbi:MAG: undecaprenyl-diphosphate phosphatase [Planctomycetes bacterium]|nr:undecaprenyl-diphosphate phosphatase [Planctomycetota bacterium]